VADSTIVIPVFNQVALTRRCLDALFRQGHRRIVVVNDASTDATAEMLSAHGKELRVITHSENQGFGASCNAGARVADTEFVVFLNNDTLPENGWLDALEEHARRHPRAAAVGSKLVYPDRTIQHAGVVICEDRHPRHLYAGFPADEPVVNVSRRFQIVTAACMLVRRRAFEDAGGFDLRFRNGFEDVDLCLRLGEAGHEIHYCAESVVVHLESMSPGRFQWDRQNVALYRERWMSRVRPDDVRYYLDDGLLRLNYEGRYPAGLTISPMVAVVEDASHNRELEHRVRDLNRRLTELSRENTRLRAGLECNVPDSPILAYQQLRDQIREGARRRLPPGATVLVVSKGDGALLDLPGCRGWHFPQTEQGAYAGYHPADSTEVIRHLERMREKGADHLLIPAPAMWWLDYYEDFRRYLNSRCRALVSDKEAFFLFSLS
jgi:GT2 family glycosyltransferase